MQIPSQTSIKCSQLSAVPENLVDKNEEVAVCLSKNTGDPPFQGRERGQAKDTVPLMFVSNAWAGKRTFSVSLLC